MMRLAITFGIAQIWGQPQPGQDQKIPPPNWLPDAGKDLFNDIEEDAIYFGDAACEAREKLLKVMAGKDEQGAADHRVRVLSGLGVCELRKSNWDKATLRFESTLSEINAPSDDALLKNQQFAPYVLMKQAAAFLKRHEITQGGTQLRRCVEVSKRNLKTILKSLHKQAEKQGQGVPPLEVIVSEISGYGKTGQILPMLVKQYPMFKQELQQLEVLEGTLDALDQKIEWVDASIKNTRVKLDVSKGKAQQGTLMYVRALASPKSPIDGECLFAAKELEEKGVVKSFLAEATGDVKGGTLIKRTKDATACKAFPKTCEALHQVPDVQSNVFGETRVLAIKQGKTQQLDACSTNANIAVLVAAKDGVSVKVANSDPVDLQVGKPVVVDFCRDATIHSTVTTLVLFAQAWHPEFAAVERTSELRARSKAFGLADADVKAAAQVVNDYAKKHWDKASTHWRQNSPQVDELRNALKDEKKIQKDKEEEEAEARRKQAEDGDEERQQNLEKLEQKRAERKQREEAAEQKRLERKKQLEAERLNRDPWLQSAEVTEAETNLADLKQARRDANVKLEFDLSTQLTKDISAAERHLNKVIKLMKKEYKKGLKVPLKESKVSNDAQKPDQKISVGVDVDSLKKQLEDVKAKKALASENEDFTEAKRLKDEQKEIESKLQLQHSGGSPEVATLKQELENVKKQKAKASEDEDFSEAKRLKGLQQEIESKLRKLEL